MPVETTPPRLLSPQSYLTSYVRPLFTPLITALLSNRPNSVVEFTIDWMSREGVKIEFKPRRHRILMIDEEPNLKELIRKEIYKEFEENDAISDILVTRLSKDPKKIKLLQHQEPKKKKKKSPAKEKKIGVKKAKKIEGSKGRQDKEKLEKSFKKKTKTLKKKKAIVGSKKNLPVKIALQDDIDSEYEDKVSYDSAPVKDVARFSMSSRDSASNFILRMPRIANILETGVDLPNEDSERRSSSKRSIDAFKNRMIFETDRLSNEINKSIQKGYSSRGFNSGRESLRSMIKTYIGVNSSIKMGFSFWNTFNIKKAKLINSRIKSSKYLQNVNSKSQDDSFNSEITLEKITIELKEERSSSREKVLDPHAIYNKSNNLSYELPDNRFLTRQTKTSNDSKLIVSHNSEGLVNDRRQQHDMYLDEIFSGKEINRQYKELVDSEKKGKKTVSSNFSSSLRILKEKPHPSFDHAISQNTAINYRGSETSPLKIVESIQPVSEYAILQKIGIKEAKLRFKTLSQSMVITPQSCEATPKMIIHQGCILRTCSLEVISKYTPKQMIVEKNELLKKNARIVYPSLIIKNKYFPDINVAIPEQFYFKKTTLKQKPLGIKKITSPEIDIAFPERFLHKSCRLRQRVVTIKEVQNYEVNFCLPEKFISKKCIYKPQVLIIKSVIDSSSSVATPATFNWKKCNFKLQLLTIKKIVSPESNIVILNEFVPKDCLHKYQLLAIKDVLSARSNIAIFEKFATHKCFFKLQSLTIKEILYPDIHFAIPEKITWKESVQIHNILEVKQILCPESDIAILGKYCWNICTSKHQILHVKDRFTPKTNLLTSEQMNWKSCILRYRILTTKTTLIPQLDIAFEEKIFSKKCMHIFQILTIKEIVSPVSDTSNLEKNTFKVCKSRFEILTVNEISFPEIDVAIPEQFYSKKCKFVSDVLVCKQIYLPEIGGACILNSPSKKCISRVPSCSIKQILIPEINIAFIEQFKAKVAILNSQDSSEDIVLTPYSSTASIDPNNEPSRSPSLPSSLFPLTSSPSPLTSSPPGVDERVSPVGNGVVVPVLPLYSQVQRSRSPSTHLSGLISPNVRAEGLLEPGQASYSYRSDQSSGFSSFDPPEQKNTLSSSGGSEKKLRWEVDSVNQQNEDYEENQQNEEYQQNQQNEDYEEVFEDKAWEVVEKSSEVKQEVLKVLREYVYLKHLKSKYLEVIADSMLVKNIDPGQIVHDLGDHCENIDLIYRGHLEAFGVNFLTGEDESYGTYKQGDFFGIYYIINDKPFSCQVLSKDAVIICQIPKKIFLYFASNHMNNIYNVTLQLFKQFELTKDMRELAVTNIGDKYLYKEIESDETLFEQVCSNSNYRMNLVITAI